MHSQLLHGSSLLSSGPHLDQLWRHEAGCAHHSTGCWLTACNSFSDAKVAQLEQPPSTNKRVAAFQVPVDDALPQRPASDQGRATERLGCFGDGGLCAALDKMGGMCCISRVTLQKHSRTLQGHEQAPSMITQRQERYHTAASCMDVNLLGS